MSLQAAETGAIAEHIPKFAVAKAKTAVALCQTHLDAFELIYVHGRGVADDIMEQPKADIQKLMDAYATLQNLIQEASAHVGEA